MIGDLVSKETVCCVRPWESQTMNLLRWLIYVGYRPCGRYFTLNMNGVWNKQSEMLALPNFFLYCSIVDSYFAFKESKNNCYLYKKAVIPTQLVV